MSKATAYLTMLFGASLTVFTILTNFGGLEELIVASIGFTVFVVGVMHRDLHERFDQLEGERR